VENAFAWQHNMTAADDKSSMSHKLTAFCFTVVIMSILILCFVKRQHEQSKPIILLI